jgi:hypothetical protein
MVLNRFVDVRLKSQFATRSSRLALVTVVAFAAGWFWALSPLGTSLLYICPSSWTEADLVRHLWHFRLIQPEWVSSPPHYDYLRWAQFETLARFVVVFLGWICGVAWALLGYRGGHDNTAPNRLLQWMRRLRFCPQFCTGGGAPLSRAVRRRYDYEASQGHDWRGDSRRH